MFANAPDLIAWFPEPDGLPRPDWKAIREFIRSNTTPEHFNGAYEEITRIWLQKTCDRLGGAYAVAESENFCLLSELEEKQRNELLSFLEQCRTRIIRTLADISLPARNGKHVVMRFSTADEYYRYVPFFYDDGSWADSPGIFLQSAGYMHIAYYHDDRMGSDRSLLAHELTHWLVCRYRSG